MNHRFLPTLLMARTFALAVTALMLLLALVSAYHVVVNHRAIENPGMQFGPTAPDGSRKLLDVVPGSAAAAAGLHAGDIVEPVPFVQRNFTSFAGRRADLTVKSSDGRVKTATVIFQPASATESNFYRAAVQRLDVLVSLISLLTALLILARAEPTRANVAIGLSLALGGYTGYILPFPALVGNTALSAIAVFDQARYFTLELLLLLFAQFFYKDNVGPLSRGLRIVASGTCVAIAIAAASNIVYVVLGFVAILPDPFQVRTFIALMAALSTFTILVSAWLRCAQNQRGRALVLVISIGVLMIGTVLISSGYLNQYLYTTGEVLLLVFQGLFAYAIIRHKVVDLRFAVNRALVFTAISTMLLIVFAITEFAVDKLLHFEGRQKNVIFDAAVALGIILCFHRIQHWVSHRIDHTFFHHWYAAAETLRTFIKRAPHILSPAVLEESYLAEMRAYCGARAVTQYARMPNLSYERIQGDATLPQVIDADIRLAVALRHDRAFIDMSTENFGLAADLAFPMLLRDAVVGFILVSPKTDGTGYRPDEIKLLGDCVRSYTLDRESLRVDQLEKQIVEMTESKARLENLVQLLLPAASEAISG